MGIARRWVFLAAFAALLFALVALVSNERTRAQAPAGFWNEKGPEVDVALVLAVDISYSMDHDELTVQREGYIAALTSREVLEAIRRGVTGKIAVTYLEWAGTTTQNVVVDWTVIQDQKSADAFTKEMSLAPIRRARRTSITGAIEFSMERLRLAALRPIRRVIDISGDGPNNEGGPVTRARDAAVAAGVTINGLPIILPRSLSSVYDVAGLDEYYEDCVIGGQGAFIEVISERGQFAPAIRAKILREVAQSTMNDISPRPIQQRRSDCLVGERQWQRQWGN